MTTSAPDTSATFFEHLYTANHAQPDPWNFAGSPYELHRYDRTVAALAHRRYQHALEPGCSVGVLTARLAALCDTVDALDFAPTAIAEARRRCAALPNVHLHVLSLPDWLAAPPATGFDLLVLSEIGYYFSAETWSNLATRLIHPLAPGATVLGVHWLGHSPDHRLSGDTVHDLLSAIPGLQLDLSERYDANPDPQQRFRLDRWLRV